MMVQKSQPLTKPPQSWGSFGGLGEESAAFGIFFGRKIPRFRNKEVRIPTKDEGGLIRTFEIGPSAPTRRTFRMLLLASSQFVHPKTYAIAMSCPPNPPNIIIPSSTIQGSFTFTVYYWPGIAPLIPSHFTPGPQRPNLIPSMVAKSLTPADKPVKAIALLITSKTGNLSLSNGIFQTPTPQGREKKLSGKEKHQTPPT